MASWCNKYLIIHHAMHGLDIGLIWSHIQNCYISHDVLIRFEFSSPNFTIFILCISFLRLPLAYVDRIWENLYHGNWICNWRLHRWDHTSCNGNSVWEDSEHETRGGFAAESIIYWGIISTTWLEFKILIYLKQLIFCIEETDFNFIKKIHETIPNK